MSHIKESIRFEAPGSTSAIQWEDRKDCGRYINIAEIEIYVCMDSIHLVKYGKAEKTGLGYTQGVPDTWTDPASIQVGI